MSHVDTTNPRLGASVRHAIKEYFSNLDGMSANNIYSLVIAEIERPLLETVMEYANKNQSKAAEWLGISRNTLRKLLSKYNLN